MAEPEIYLVVALSGRALAVAVRRSGRRPVVLDLFGDADMRAGAEDSLVVEGDFEHGFEDAPLLAAAERLAPAALPPVFGLAYSAGFEARPDLLAKLGDGRRLYGNASDTIARTKDPQVFFSLLDRLSIPYPEISYAMPADPAGWLMKRIGASGGGHVERARAGAMPRSGCYLQRRMEGRSVGVSFLADGRNAFLLGFSEQWSSPGPGSESYRFGGLLQPADISKRISDALPAMLDALVLELRLVGLNSLDLIVDGGAFYVLEVNPRPGANLDILDGGDPIGLFGLHVGACEGRLPRHWTPPPKATAMSVLYADRPLQAPMQVAWADWVADRPAPGATIDAGAPICTVLAAEPSREAVRQAIAARTAFVFAQLRDADSHGMSAAG